jgi:branched-subunit amino acid transport protein
VLGAIAIPGILAPRGEISLIDTVPAVIAAVATWLGWKFTRQIAVGLIVGLGLWWAILAVMVAVGVER